MSDQKAGPQTILELRTKNVKRIHVVEITPEGEVVVIGGNNAQGKSSTLDSLVYGLKGKKSFPKRIVRDGADEAEIIIKTQNFEVKRTVGADGKTHLELKKDGVPIKRAPQRVIDELCEGISFDPEAFSKMTAKEQAEHLRKLVSLDLSGIDDEIERLFSERKDANSDYQRLKGQLDGYEFHPGLPDEEKTVSDLMKELEAVNAHNRTQDDRLQKLQGLRTKRQRTEQDVKDDKKKIEELKGRIEALQAKVEQGEKILDEIVEQGIALKGEADAFQPRSADEVTGQVRQIEETNAKVRSNQQCAKVEKQVTMAREKAEQLTKQLEGARSEKQRRIASVDMPVKGLAFDDHGSVTFNGVVLADCSSAEQLRVAVSIALKSNPDLPVALIRDGSLLDKQSRKMVAEMAREAGAQVWIEVVTDDADDAIIIEDGAVLRKNNG